MGGEGLELSLGYVKRGMLFHIQAEMLGSSWGESGVQARCLSLYPLKIPSVRFQSFLHVDRDRGP